MFEMKGSNLENRVWNEMAIHEIIFEHGQTLKKKKYFLEFLSNSRLFWYLQMLF